MSVTLCRAVGFGQRCGRSAAGGNPPESGIERRRIDDRVVLVPRSAQGIGCFGQPYWGTARDLCFLKLSLRKKRYPFPIGREEGLAERPELPEEASGAVQAAWAGRRKLK